ncbi:hypothetical protein V6N13_138007 [Hibiscus sabdariffa]|uniref:Uncharacterized protein n=1 Tax=Hibiscus sabdariffa TaxID=183260 RepID=A0ABR2QC66_9ROSI
MQCMSNPSKRISNAIFAMSTRPYATGPATFDDTTTIGILEYEKSVSASKSNNKKLPLLRAKIPQFNDFHSETSKSNTSWGLKMALVYALPILVAGEGNAGEGVGGR